MPPVSPIPDRRAQNSFLRCGVGNRADRPRSVATAPGEDLVHSTICAVRSKLLGAVRAGPCPSAIGLEVTGGGKFWIGGIAMGIGSATEVSGKQPGPEAGANA